jgi:UPF0716 protein FxsA
LVFVVSLLLFVAAEIASFVVVAKQIGFLSALALVLLVSALGFLIVRRVGIGVLAHTRERLARGEMPTTELLDGLVVLIGGVMICVPGFVGDTLGLLLMIGPIRRLVIRAGGRWIARRVQTTSAGDWQVIDARSRPMGPDSPPPTRPSTGSLDPGDH